MIMEASAKHQVSKGASITKRTVREAEKPCRPRVGVNVLKFKGERHVIPCIVLEV